MSDTRATEWYARLVISFIGVPSAGLSLTAVALNVQAASSLATTDGQERVFAACAVFMTMFIAGLPLVIEVLRIRAAELASVARAIWAATIAAGIVMAANAAGDVPRRADFLTIVGSLTATGAPFALFVATVEVCGAYGLAFTARTVRELLEPQQAPVKTEPEPSPATATSAAPAVDPEIGWQMWFQSCVAVVRGSRVAHKDAYAHYEAWASLNDVTAVVPRETFGRRMTDALPGIGGGKMTSNGIFYTNVTLSRLGSDGIAINEPNEGGAE